jgi:Ca2+-transporting ATPase
VSALAVAAEAASDIERGLSAAEAAGRLKQFGPNALPQAPAASPLKLLLRQFSSLIVWVLIGAAIISGLLQEWIDAAAIIAIVVLNGLLGFVQEFRSERSLAALRRMTVTVARVVRDGALLTLPAVEVVPGDVIQVEAGDRVPADARLVYCAGLQTQEASLTGESSPVPKAAEPILPRSAALADRRNMIHMGTAAVSGKARALVVGTGLHTELGRIASSIEAASREEREETPLQRRLEKLGHTLLWLCLGVVLIVFLAGELRGVPPLTMFLTAVSLAVAAIPEGLPAVVTITLAVGVTRMVKRNALIRRLPAVETLGSVTVICSDKTGTLTKNEMTVTALWQGGQAFAVSGEGYAPEGKVVREGGAVFLDAEPGLMALLRAGVLCNGAELGQQHGTWSIEGDPTEAALLVAAAKAGLLKSALERESPFAGEVAFDSERKKMTMVRRGAAGPVAYVKGAPDVLLRDCASWLDPAGRVVPLSEEVRRAILKANQEFASQALRVIGVAVRSLNGLPEAWDAAVLEKDLTFLGLAGMKDPPRPEARAAIETCAKAGIRTVMITGDHKETAQAVATDLGLMRDGAQARSGVELDRLSDAELGAQVERIVVYARVSAAHKLRVVRAWKAAGAVVAMTGDGVNDAPAVKAADIGVAMGMTGTDVTKEAADMVVTDDNFASIAAAVEEGRATFDNIRKSIHFLLSCNVGEILLMLFATLLGLPLPLLPVQILWVNLVTDGLPALALAVDPKDPALMRRPPRRADESILSRERILTILGQGFAIALISILAFAYCLYVMDLNVDMARTLTFMTLIGAQLAHALNCRNERLSIFSIGLLSNPALLLAVGVSASLQATLILMPWSRDIFKLEPFDPQHWLLALGAGVLMLATIELWKAVARTRGNA